MELTFVLIYYLPILCPNGLIIHTFLKIGILDKVLELYNFDLIELIYKETWVVYYEDYLL